MTTPMGPTPKGDRLSGIPLPSTPMPPAPTRPTTTLLPGTHAPQLQLAPAISPPLQHRINLASIAHRHLSTSGTHAPHIGGQREVGHNPEAGYPRINSASPLFPCIGSESGRMPHHSPRCDPTQGARQGDNACPLMIHPSMNRCRL